MATMRRITIWTLIKVFLASAVIGIIAWLTLPPFQTIQAAGVWTSPLDQGPPAQITEQAPNPISVTLTLPPYQVVRQVDGYDVVQIEGFSLAGVPGEPLLPRQVVNVALPPGAVLDSMMLTASDIESEILDGTYQVALAVSDRASTGEKHANSYSSPDFAYLPVLETFQPVRLLSPGQMRKWRFARVEFSPCQYNAETGELSIVTRLTLHVSYDMQQAEQDSLLLMDNTMDDVARQILINYDEAQAWYSLQVIMDQPGLVYDYVIITTNAIQSGSNNLSDFVAHKQNLGYSMLVVTEDEYGSLSGQSPNGTAEKIRQWLIDNYAALSIRYVLLIGDPDPVDGDVPMKMCWPRRGASDGYQESPTDFYYADLTGDWNKDDDGDGYFGEWEDFQAEGGVDLVNEVFVGRIPVYNAEYATLDAILQKSIQYENQAVDSISWRRSALLSMSFSTTEYDGAPLAEQMKDDYLTPAGFNTWTLYQQGGGACALDSDYTSNQELLGGTLVRDRWAAYDYGLVVWWGHGTSTSALVGCDGCWDGTLFNVSYASVLDDGHPSMVYQNSCLNGKPEDSENLQYTLLQNGGITTVGASRVSWFNPGVGYGYFDGNTTNSGIGYEYAGRLVSGQAAGAALYNTKSSMVPATNTRLMNFYDFNLYGDPSLALGLPQDSPTNLAAVSVSPTQINLTWNDNSFNELGLKIERSPDGLDSWTKVFTTTANVTSYSDTGLTPDSTFFYRVKAYNESGDSGVSNVANATTPALVSNVFIKRIPAGEVVTGGLVRFTATAHGTTPFTYTWRVNGTNQDCHTSVLENRFISPGVYTVGVTVYNTWSQGSYTTTLSVRQSSPLEPDLSSSYKLAGLSDVEQGDVITYTLHLRNNSRITATAILTDQIPDDTVLIMGSAFSSDNNPVVLIGGALRWMGNVISGTPVIIQFSVVIPDVLDVGMPITNVATLDDGYDNISRLEAQSRFNPGYWLTINDGAMFTNSPTVTLRYSWDLGDDITTVQVSNDGGFADGYNLAVNPHTPVIENWVLSTYSDVVLPRLVYARYRDASGRYYGPVQDDIIYDPNPPPPPTVEIITQTTSSGFSGGQDVIIRVTVSDDNSGVNKIQVSNSSDFYYLTEYPINKDTTDIPWVLSPWGDVYVRVFDRAGNISATSTAQGAQEFKVFLPAILKP